MAKTHLSQNEGLIIYIASEEFVETSVEISSLPHFHRYSIYEWKFILEDFFSKESFRFDQIELSSPFFNTTEASVIKEGELLFVIESVLFAFIEKNFPQSLSSISNKEIKINALYSKALRLENLPNCLKIKIRPNPHSLQETTEIMSKLLAKNSAIIFRLDGNRTFELQELNSFVNSLDEKNLLNSVQYIEEPFKNFSDTYHFQRFSHVPVALDESITYFFDKLDAFSQCYFVLKPSLLGLSRCFKLSRRYPGRVIISSSYEFPSAMRALLYLSAINFPQYHGLDTIKFLPNDSGKELDSFLLTF